MIIIPLIPSVFSLLLISVFVSAASRSRNSRDVHSLLRPDPDSLLEIIQHSRDARDVRHLHRNRRGFVSWMKKVLHIKTTPQPTTPTVPPIRSTTPGSDVEEYKKLLADLQAHGGQAKITDFLPNQASKVTLLEKQDAHKQVDELLPPSLRRAKILHLKEDNQAKSTTTPKTPKHPRITSQELEETKLTETIPYISIRSHSADEHNVHHGHSINSKDVDPFKHHRGKLSLEESSTRLKTPSTRQSTKSNRNESAKSKQHRKESSEEKWKHIFESFEYERHSMEVKASNVPPAARRKRSKL